MRGGPPCDGLGGLLHQSKRLSAPLAPSSADSEARTGRDGRAVPALVDRLPGEPFDRDTALKTLNKRWIRGIGVKDDTTPS